ncbi:hypothetical protein ACBO_06120 [Acinetobacter bouvetii]|nr:hypothetical protein ACBO_06120 [Acinetobacter bouvetii]
MGIHFIFTSIAGDVCSMSKIEANVLTVIANFYTFNAKVKMINVKLNTAK